MVLGRGCEVTSAMYVDSDALHLASTIPTSTVRVEMKLNECTQLTHNERKQLCQRVVLR